jgi:hypothetical protein
MERHADIKSPCFLRRRGGRLVRAAICIGLLLAAPGLRAERIDLRVSAGADLTLQFEEGLQGAAEAVRGRYPQLKKDLETRFGWEMDFAPTVVLIKTPALFQRLSGSSLIVAFAAPRDNLIVMDYSQPSLHRRFGGNVLKHELVHLLLHHHIRSADIPRWFEEGVAQWSSEGVAELLVSSGPVILEKAMVSGKIIPFSRLRTHFPRQRQALALAYAQSRSLVDYLADEYGADKILEILNRMKAGTEFEKAVQTSLGEDLSAVQQSWLASGQSASVWWGFLARHVYEILFFGAALMTVVGFVRFLIRKRAYRDEWDDD